jgi:hypothetical protein
MADLGMSTGDLARAVGVHLDTAWKWRSGLHPIVGKRTEPVRMALEAWGADAESICLALSECSFRREMPKVRPASPWGGGMPFDYFVGLRLEAEGLEEAA